MLTHISTANSIGIISLLLAILLVNLLINLRLRLRIVTNDRTCPRSPSASSPQG